jgi:hypothetical protein
MNTLISKQNKFLPSIYIHLKNLSLKRFALKIKQRKIYIRAYSKVKNKFKKSSRLKYYLNLLEKIKLFKYYRYKGYKFVKSIGAIFNLQHIQISDTKNVYKYKKNVKLLKRTMYIAKLYIKYKNNKRILKQFKKIIRYGKKFYKIGKIKGFGFKEPKIMALLKFKSKFLAFMYINFNVIVPIYLFRKLYKFKSNKLKNFSYYNFFLHHTKRLYKEIMFNLYWTFFCCYKYIHTLKKESIYIYNKIYFNFFNSEFINNNNNILYINKNLNFFKFKLYLQKFKNFKLVKLIFNTITILKFFNFLIKIKFGKKIKYNNKRLRIIMKSKLFTKRLTKRLKLLLVLLNKFNSKKFIKLKLYFLSSFFKFLSINKKNIFKEFKFKRLIYLIRNSFFNKENYLFKKIFYLVKKKNKFIKSNKIYTKIKSVTSNKIFKLLNKLKKLNLKTFNILIKVLNIYLRKNNIFNSNSNLNIKFIKKLLLKFKVKQKNNLKFKINLTLLKKLGFYKYMKIITNIKQKKKKRFKFLFTQIPRKILKFKYAIKIYNSKFGLKITKSKKFNKKLIFLKV